MMRRCQATHSPTVNGVQLQKGVVDCSQKKNFVFFFLFFYFISKRISVNLGTRKNSVADEKKGHLREGSDIRI